MKMNEPKAHVTISHQCSVRKNAADGTWSMYVNGIRVKRNLPKVNCKRCLKETNALVAGDHVTLNTSMWGLAWGSTGIISYVSPDRITAFVVPTGGTQAYALPLDHLTRTQGE